MVINGVTVTSGTTINVLGVLFDCKLHWGPHIEKTLQKADKALNAIKLIKKYFNLDELLQLVTANYYSIMYYNAEVWHTPTLKRSLQTRLLSASAKALKACSKSSDLWMLNFDELHEMAGRATPAKLMQYKMSLQLYKTYNLRIPITDWTNLNMNSVFTSRQTCFITNKTNKYKVGMNELSNRLWYLNGKIKLDWLNLTFDSFKVNCKKLFLK